jgi:pyruvate kinase
LLDTKGPEIRTGFFADGKKKIDLVKGETIVLTSDYSFKGSEKKLACSYQSLAKSVKPGQEILVADGSLVLTVLSTDEALGEVTARIENNASIGGPSIMSAFGAIVPSVVWVVLAVWNAILLGARAATDLSLPFFCLFFSYRA